MSTYDDEAFAEDENARNEFYQSDDNNETGDETYEAGSEINSESGINAGSSRGGVGGVGDLDNELTTSDDDASTDFEPNSKLKFKHAGSGRHYNNSRFKEDWNSSEDTNERYCICKDISYGDMIACDNARVILFLVLNYSYFHIYFINF
jgi:hypothetical protein